MVLRQEPIGHGFVSDRVVFCSGSRSEHKDVKVHNFIFYFLIIVLKKKMIYLREHCSTNIR
jgi:hypothetical protein